MSISRLPVRLVTEGPASLGPSENAGAANAYRHQPFRDVASIGAAVGPLPRAGNPVAGRNCAGAAALALPAQRTRYPRHGVADYARRQAYACKHPRTSCFLAAILLSPDFAGFGRTRPVQGRIRTNPA